MSLDKILAISGKPGLYQVITQTRNGFVVESLIDKKRISVTMQNNLSLLSEIAIYTLTEEVPLREVFKKIKTKENGAPTPINHKDQKDILEEYFFDVLPDYDEDRVYTSDIKKIIQWYNLLQKHNSLDILEEEQEKVTSQEDEE